jgi:hypothetical protein
MKLRILVFALAFLSGLFAVASDFVYEGRFVEERAIYTDAYQTRTACVDAEGSWDGDEEDEGVCVFLIENEVQLDRDDSGQLRLKVSMVGNSYHTCDFESEAGLVLQPEALLFSAATEVWDSDAGEFVQKACEVTLTYASSNELKMSNNGFCSSNCGANLTLDIEKAVRK